jgi:hypothetical protein
VLPGPADLSKFPSIDPKILFAALDMPFYLVNPVGFVRRLDALKSGWAVVAIDVDAIQEQDVKVNIQVESRSEALD